jgi:hypothetical protein
MDRRRAIPAALVLAVVAVAAWWLWPPSEEQRIRDRLDAFAEDFNEPSEGGLGSVAHAARLGGYFTDGVRVDLGPGTAPIEGRMTLIGMAARLQPRTASFVLEVEDVTVDLTSERTADVSLTAVFRRRSIVSGEESLDAREFALALTKAAGDDWVVDRVTLIETLK